MKYYINPKIVKLKKKIVTESRKLRDNKLALNFLLNYLIFVYLKAEKFIHQNDKVNPNKFLMAEVLQIEKLVQTLKSFKDFSNKSKISLHTFSRENTHQNLFNSLWVNYTLNEYKKERLGRYIHRIKINKLSNLIKNKKIVDFGCGHGNFLMTCALFKAKECTGIDFGPDSIKFANNVKRKLFSKKSKTKINFFKRSVYRTKLKSNYYDFAIQNGVFHHLNFEKKAYKEVYRVLKTGGYFWVYTVGGGGLKDFLALLIQEIFKNVSNDYKIKFIRSLGLSTNKEYYVGDAIGAKYRFTTLSDIKNRLEKMGFKFITQLNGGTKTDFDFPYKKTKFFRKKFGEGDLRILFQKTK